jgi:hypothetical protein
MNDKDAWKEILEPNILRFDIKSIMLGFVFGFFVILGFHLYSKVFL